MLPLEGEQVQSPPLPFLHRELVTPPSQQGLNGTASTKRYHAFTANTDGPSSRNRGLNNFNGGASSTWGAGKEIVVQIRVLQAQDDEFDLGFHELSLCVNEWSSLNSTVSVKWSSLNSTLVINRRNGAL
ncbi:beta-glucosidase 24-like [Pyrus ussuriensis x Pyrus communis]|uniref:Beta-glucosidase 24-like n=1 Tax=Pyrus ussuriensis x Pyrus communis TaxID=2448454 RepID=A0A5N5IDQ4_9ROSA|nr:beta-glucosidase 24-like [Pyrus ussuriensis x Pyrus communis]